MKSGLDCGAAERLHTGVMKTKWILALVGLLGAFVLSGCVASVDGRQHLGVPLMKDSLEARYERSPMEIWGVAKEVLKYNGQLYSEDVLKSTLEASVNTRTVWVKVEPLDDRVTRVIVQTRTKGGGTDLELASEIDKQIALRLATGVMPPPRSAGRAGG
jgi:hypothetical protein